MHRSAGPSGPNVFYQQLSENAIRSIRSICTTGETFMSETVAVEFTVTGIERVKAGALIGLANVDLEIAGIRLTLQGIQILQARTGGLYVNAPKFRDTAGTWRSAAVLPDTLRDALGAEVLSVFTASP